MYGNIIRISCSMRRAFAFHSPATKSPVMINIATNVTSAEMAIKPEITAFAAFHMAASPSDFSFALKIGMNAAVNAPSPSSLRNKFGTVWAKMKAL